MCGIAGIVKRFDSEVELVSNMEKMLAKLHHRGPDNKGLSSPISNIILGHTRLKIIDLDPRSNQPMVSKRGNEIVFNGEIYNHQELKTSQKRNTLSDTESLLLALEKDFDATINQLDGMFAFAYFDKELSKLRLVRDPVGIKPLYYYFKDGVFIFSSEIKAILECDFVERELDEESIYEFFKYGYILTPNTGFKYIKQVKPGHYLELDDGEITFKKYHAWKKPEKKEVAQNEFEGFLRSSLGKRLMSDVPMTTLLSGGIDSSAMAVALKSLDQKMHYSSIMSESEKYSEHIKAQRVADSTDQEITISSVPIVNFSDLEKIIYYADDLICDPALISNYLLFGEVSKRFTVSLSGDGADELFLGYHAHQATMMANNPFLNTLARFGNIITPLIERFESSESKYLFSQKIKRYNMYCRYRFPENHMLWRSPGLSDIQGENRSLEILEKHFSGEQSLESKMTSLDMQTYLEGNILKKIDRMSMAHSVENRVPFLSKEMINYSLRVPDKLKINGKNQKVLIKNYLRNKLPSEIVTQKKQGFGLMNSLSIKTFNQFISQQNLENIIKREDDFQIFTVFCFKKWLEIYNL